MSSVPGDGIVTFQEFHAMFTNEKKIYEKGWLLASKLRKRINQAEGRWKQEDRPWFGDRFGQDSEILLLTTGQRILMELSGGNLNAKITPANMVSMLTKLRMKTSQEDVRAMMKRIDSNGKKSWSLCLPEGRAYKRITLQVMG